MIASDGRTCDASSKITTSKGSVDGRNELTDERAHHEARLAVLRDWAGLGKQILDGHVPRLLLRFSCDDAGGAGDAGRSTRITGSHHSGGCVFDELAVQGPVFLHET